MNIYIYIRDNNQYTKNAQVYRKNKRHGITQNREKVNSEYLNKNEKKRRKLQFFKYGL